jgi:NADH:ubiquinone oxidoreductase subunit K
MAVSYVSALTNVYLVFKVIFSIQLLVHVLPSAKMVAMLMQVEIVLNAWLIVFNANGTQLSMHPSVLNALQAST